ncbi:MAG TPA: phosphate acetyltransferase [Rugosimonospora sp.]|nr:phosphate acetyltransferase [Rugosimonospora sp.]
MARTLYLTGLEPGGGKSTVALGVMELLSRRVRRLGAFRPLRRGTDAILDLLRDQYQLDLIGHGASYAEAAALIADGRLDELVGQVVDRYRGLAGEADAVLVVGTDFGSDGGPHSSGGLPDELALNIRIANELGAAVLAVLDGRGRDADDLAAAVRGAYHTLADLHATQVAVVANRVAPGERDKALSAVDDLPLPVYAVPDVPAVSAPTVAEVADALGARRLLGGPEAYARDVLDVVVGGATVPTLLDYLHDGALVVTPGDRADLVVLAYAVNAAGTAALAGLVLTVGLSPDARVLDLARRLGDGLPMMVVEPDSFSTVSRLAGLEGRLRAGNPRKVQAALGAFESAVDGAELAGRLDIARSSRVTPLMFEYELISRARAASRHVVLPEGTEERILRAAEILLRRGVCRLTLLGPPDGARRRIRELGLSLPEVSIVDPVASPWREEFAAGYARLRAHRGVTLDAARDTVTDENYFGTMMVHSGYADAMVSGAVHPTADTIRPAFEIIRTVPGVSVASSVFFMCLPEQVLVYGDCAINPDPDPDQLADIAISSAATAAMFGVEPRIAMLSYSTGASGHGADVDKVAAATALVRSRRPDLAVDGPMQYDAAVDPGVAATKLPGSTVAGHATVFIFPDLNTGNNTYKAVQRSAGAVAVGPVLQGLRKPVNDLSRGATVPDIVNTVAITAVQA